MEKKKRVVENEETRRKETGITTVADGVKTSPLPEKRVTNREENGMQKE